MKKIFFIAFSLISTIAFSQKDSLQVGDKYLEDQLYISISYNVLSNQPSGVKASGFSYGFSTGFIKDIPFNKNRNIGLGVGLGYGFDSYNQGLKVVENNNIFTFEIDNSLLSNKLTTHSLELPIEFRWRNSTKNRYAFWRIYTGLKITYNFANTFTYNTSSETITLNGIDAFNNWQTGLTLSTGYDAFNFFFYYGLTPILKDTLVDNNAINTNIIKFGLSFYIL